jgi:phospholipase C
VIDDTDPARVDHTGDTATDGQLVPDYTQLGFRVPAIVVSNLAQARVDHRDPYEHTSTPALIESTFGLHSITARDANARNLTEVLNHDQRPPVQPGVIPTSSQVPGPANDAAAICSAASVQSISPQPVHTDTWSKEAVTIARSGYPTGAGMAGFGRQFRNG